MSAREFLRAPAFELTLDGQSITAKVQPRLIDLTLSQARGGEADQLDIRLTDTDGLLQIPRTGVEITLALGWEGAALVPKGRFVVDEVEHTGAPDQVSIRARAADLRGPLRNRTDQSWHQTTLGTVVATVAKRNGLQARIDDRLASRGIEHIDQTNESDISFVSRVAALHDATATVKTGRLVVLPIADTRSSTGQQAQPLRITRASGDQHRYLQADREAYTGVRAYWHDPNQAKQRSVLVGQSGNAKRLRESHATEQDAQAAAQAEWQRIQRGAATFELSLAQGLPEADAQATLNVSGFKPEIDGTDWLVAKVTHTLSDGGMTTRLEAERKGGANAATTVQDVE